MLNYWTRTIRNSLERSFDTSLLVLTPKFCLSP